MGLRSFCMKKLLIFLLLFISTTAFADNTVKLQVLTRDKTDSGVEYSDAQYFDVSDDVNIGQWKKDHMAEVDAEKDRRIRNWTEMIKNPPLQPEPTEAQLNQELASIEEQKAQLETRKADISTKITAIQSKPIEIKPERKEELLAP